LYKSILTTEVLTYFHFLNFYFLLPVFESLKRQPTANLPLHFTILIILTVFGKMSALKFNQLVYSIRNIIEEK